MGAADRLRHEQPEDEHDGGGAEQRDPLPEPQRRLRVASGQRFGSQRKGQGRHGETEQEQTDLRGELRADRPGADGAERFHAARSAVAISVRAVGDGRGVVQGGMSQRNPGVRDPEQGQQYPGAHRTVTAAGSLDLSASLKEDSSSTNGQKLDQHCVQCNTLVVW